MQAQIKMVADPNIHQPREIDARAIHTFYIHYRIVLQKTVSMSKIKVRFIVAEINPKMIRFIIMAFLVNEITQLCLGRS